MMSVFPFLRSFTSLYYINNARFKNVKGLQKKFSKSFFNILKKACYYALRPAIGVGDFSTSLRCAAVEMTVGRVSSVSMWLVLLKIDFSTPL